MSEKEEITTKDENTNVSTVLLVLFLSYLLFYNFEDSNGTEYRYDLYDTIMLDRTQ
jgi:hypothetical protein